MKITFNPMSAPETEKVYTDKREMTKTEQGCNAYGVSFFVEKNKSWMIGNSSDREKGKSFIELQQEAGNIDSTVQQNYMTIMSHTMSEEDYAQLTREGFHFDNLDPEQAVTIVDKIKAELARCGRQIVGYTDDLNIETLAAALGSDTLARAVADSFAQADIPMTQENAESVVKAWDMASQLEAAGEGVRGYMIDNGLEPEIWNLYLAQSSGAQKASGGIPCYYAEEIQGYFARSAQGDMDGSLQEQMDKVIADAGREVNEESRQQAKWLMEKGLPLTEENLNRLQELQEVSIPVTEEAFARAVASAIAEGRASIHGNLTQNENLYQKAARLAEHYYEDKLILLEEGDITARRQLEEIRLRMTAEVNVKLLKSGFSIDTAPMEQLLNALKQAEAQLADTYFPKDERAVEKYELYVRTTRVLEEIPRLPVQTLGVWRDRTEQGSVLDFYQAGKTIEEACQRASESYEALMTTPRTDLGDSIRKAFANVDDILADMGYELTEENRRFVRILGYNRMRMTRENMESVKQADEQVRSVVEKLTPAAVLKMIREDRNPLEQSFEEVEEYFASWPQEYEESAESYSRFLYHLEQRREITPEERKEYIDVFRLLHQIEKSDGAVIGALVNSSREVSFKNLMTAVKNSRFKHMDVRMSDDEIVELKYSRMLWEQTRQAAEADADSVALLQKGELPVNVGNLLAAKALLHDTAAPYGRWQAKVQQLGGTGTQAQTSETGEMPKETAMYDAEQMTNLSDTGENSTDVMAEAAAYTNIWRRLSDKAAFQGAYREMVSDMSRQVEAASLNLAENSLDVREMQAIHKQLSVAAALVDSEEYVLPMYIGKDLAKVHLMLNHGKTQTGEVTIRADISQEMHVEAHFSLHEKKLQGFLAGNTQEEVTKLQETADIFLELVKREGNSDWKIEELPIVSIGTEKAGIEKIGTEKTVIGKAVTGAGAERVGGSLTDRKTEAEDKQTADSDLYRVAKLFLEALR